MPSTPAAPQELNDCMVFSPQCQFYSLATSGHAETNMVSITFICVCTPAKHPPCTQHAATPFTNKQTVTTNPITASPKTQKSKSPYSPAPFIQHQHPYLTRYRRPSSVQTASPHKQSPKRCLPAISKRASEQVPITHPVSPPSIHPSNRNAFSFAFASFEIPSTHPSSPFPPSNMTYPYLCEILQKHSIYPTHLLPTTVAISSPIRSCVPK